MKKIINNLIVGLAIGFVTTNISLFFYLGFSNEIVVMYWAWMLASAVFGLASCLFSIERLSPLFATLLHMTICATVAISTCYLLGYHNGSIQALISYVLPVFVLIYTVIHAVFYAKNYYDARSINAKIEKM